MMNKKSIIKYIALLLIIIGGGFFSAAFQDYIIEAIALLEPLIVKIGSLSFGTVFPGEELQKTFTVELAQGYNFEAEYQISHSVKPINPEDKAYCLTNPTDYQRCYPDLCSFLNEESQEGEGDTPGSALLSPGDILDNWLVNLNVPPIAGFVAQSYQGLTVDNSGIFGCDIEVLFIGEPPIFVEAVEVQADNPNTTYSSTLESGVHYELEAIGTANAGDTIDFDAKYSITNKISGDTWTDTVTGYESYGPTLLDLFVNGSSVDWGAYNDGHTYYWTMTGTGAPVGLQVYDIYYPNNTGLITVNIYELP